MHHVIPRQFPLLGFMLLITVLVSPHTGTSQTNLSITEFLASNESVLADQDGDYSDWIELQNMGGRTLNLEGWYLSDNENNLTKWAFPALSLAPDAYLLVFASGKNRTGEELHTNFKLSSSGEHMILTEPDGETIAFSFHGPFPAQRTDISYGLINEQWIYLDAPTPGYPNAPGAILSPPAFSVQRGFFEESFDLTLTAALSDLDIFYTLDGSLPTASDSIYTGPIPITETTIVRAISSKAGQAPSSAATHSYIFRASVISQSNTPPGYPDNWGPYSTLEGLAPADYEMDPEITQSSAYKDQVIPALRSLPSISLVTNKEHLFSLSTDPDSGGIYIHTNPPTGGIGEGWERPVSFEYMPQTGSTGIQVDAGIRIHGGHSRVPEKNPKHSFRIAFRSEYGPKKLNYDIFGGDAAETFNSLVLRAGFNQTWLHWTSSQRKIAQYINDSWVKQTYLKMGHLAAHDKFVHLYLNGMYWGLYDISERPDKEFMAHYLPGKESEFDVIKDYAELADGEINAWNELMNLAKDTANFMRIQGKEENGEPSSSRPVFLDMEKFMDYMILNFYIGNLDWDHHNWVAVRNREEPGHGFQFLPWDSERSFVGLRNDVTDTKNSNRPSYLYSQFIKDARFQAAFLERARHLLQTGGLLSPDSVAASWKKLSDQISLALIAESARWGDYRRDVHPHKTAPYELYTKEDHWDKEQKRLYEDYFPFRSDTVLQHLQPKKERIDPTLEALGDFGSFPNPFAESVSIFYEIRKASSVQVDIYDLSGRHIEQLLSQYQYKGTQVVDWTPGPLLNGVYLFKIHTSDQDRIGKLVLMR